jgi:transposase
MNLDLVSIALFILERVAERADITMPELADKLASATGTRADKKTLRAVLLREGIKFHCKSR